MSQIDSKISSDCQGGFTLFEVLVVVAILAIALGALTWLVVPNASSSVRATALEIASALRDARTAAILNRDERSVVIDLSHRTITYSHVRPAIRLPSGINMHLKTAVGETRERSRAGIRFFPNGASTGGHLEIVKGASSYRISVNWLSGGVDVSQTR